MSFTLHSVIKLVAVVFAVLVIAKLAWTHRSDEWVNALLRPPAPTEVRIKFDNGSVRDAAKPAETQISRLPGDSSPRNEAGELKKCLISGKVVYTDQVCPPGAKVAAVQGGNLTVLDAQKPQPKDNMNAQQSRKTLRDAMDLSGGNDLKAKMMDRAINQ